MADAVSLENLKEEYKKLTSNVEPKLAGEVEKLKLLETQIAKSEAELKALGVEQTDLDSIEKEFSKTVAELKSLHEELAS
jgi:hypothetical protein